MCIYNISNVYIVNYSYKQIHIEQKFRKFYAAIKKRNFLQMTIPTEDLILHG